MSTREVSASTVVAADPATVFELLADPRRHAEFDGSGTVRQAVAGPARLGPGDRLPAERELAASLGVSRATLAQALVALEVTGVVAVRHGDGTVLLTGPAS